MFIYQHHRRFQLPFQKKNKLGFTSDEPFDRNPLTILLKPGVKEKLMSITNWRSKVRNAIDRIIEESQSPHKE